ncbi:MAG TPA: nuclear transport factor 2 family protein [Acidimicrobiia bacterium]|jgi:ketosteroid isomerase-like protein
MTSSVTRAATLVQVLRAAVEGDAAAVEKVCTPDVAAWAPAVSVSSATELAALLARREHAFTDIELDVAPLDVAGDFACAEWSVTMTHTGPLVLADDTVVEPTGVRVTLHGATVAEYRGDLICSLRQYWDELTMAEQLGLVDRADNSAP